VQIRFENIRYILTGGPYHITSKCYVMQYNHTSAANLTNLLVKQHNLPPTSHMMKPTWKMAAKKLCKETSRLSCHCRVKCTWKTGFSSGFFTHGSTAIRNHTLHHHYKTRERKVSGTLRSARSMGASHFTVNWYHNN
jgi:hypothetical protein